MWEYIRSSLATPNAVSPTKRPALKMLTEMLTKHLRNSGASDEHVLLDKIPNIISASAIIYELTQYMF